MFKLSNDFEPKGDQPYAINKIVNNFLDKKREQVLLGATGTGKTFTIANIIEKLFFKLNLRKNFVIYLVNNKNLVMQTFKEMQTFFPNNKVGCYLSYFDYYRPEAYKPFSDLYIGKKTRISKEIVRMRLRTIHSLVSEKDVIVVSSVAAIYGCLSPDFFKEEIIDLFVGKKIDFSNLKESMIRMGFSQIFDDFSFEDIFFYLKKIKIGSFFLSDKKMFFIPEWSENSIFLISFGDFFITNLKEINFDEKKKMEKEILSLNIYPNRDYVKKKDKKLSKIISEIKVELDNQKKKFSLEGKYLEEKRLDKRVNEDILMLKEIGTCYGIENYSLYFDEREVGSPPSTIFDFFTEDFLTIIDESHVTIPQISAMYNTNFHRLKTLINNGFRLPSSLENRPLNIKEFFEKMKYVLYVSATPGSFELKKVDYNPIEQIIRPTCILDPIIEVRKSKGQIADIIFEAKKRIALNQKILIYALTIAMSEEISKFLEENFLKVVYIHSKLETFERHQIINSLRRGIYDVIVGINLLKEGIDLPEVSLVCILDADKPGFLRDTKSLIQIIGRASRNVDGKVIFYADLLTKNMDNAIKETNRRRKIQENYNRDNFLIPKPIIKPIKEIISENAEHIIREISETNDKKEIIRNIKELEKMMKKHSKKFEFDQAIFLRNRIYDLKKKIDENKEIL